MTLTEAWVCEKLPSRSGNRLGPREAWKLLDLSAVRLVIRLFSNLHSMSHDSFRNLQS